MMERWKEKQWKEKETKESAALEDHPHTGALWQVDGLLKVD
jgi:hypothetical protein